MIAKDLMTHPVTCVGPEDSILKVADLIFKNNWDGLPVIDAEGKSIGLVNQYDLLTKGANIHLPTFLKLMSEMPVYKKDSSSLKPELQKIVTLTVKDIMNPDPITVFDDTTIEEVSRTFAEHHRVNPIPVIDHDRKIVGIISRFDLIKLYTGAESANTDIERETSVDKKVDLFVKGFEKNFVVVSKFTPTFWKITSVMFVIVGFIIAMAWIIRIELQN